MMPHAIHTNEQRGLGRGGRDSDEELVRRIQQAHDAVAARALLATHSGLVMRVARGAAADLPLEDLVSEGRLGVLEAVHAFDRARGSRFSALAEKRVRTRIRRYVEARTRAGS